MQVRRNWKMAAMSEQGCYISQIEYGIQNTPGYYVWYAVGDSIHLTRFSMNKKSHFVFPRSGLSFRFLHGLKAVGCPEFYAVGMFDALRSSYVRGTG